MILFEIGAIDPRLHQRRAWIVAAGDENEARSLIPAAHHVTDAKALTEARSRRPCVIGRIGAMDLFDADAGQVPSAIASSLARSSTKTLSAFSSRISSLLRSCEKVRLTVSTVSPR